jgi:aminoglycoside 6'-N-acetyltransferase
MKVTFIPLRHTYFDLLLHWLQGGHVKKWWDSDINWTQSVIKEKYETYVDGFKLENNIAKPMHAFIFCVSDKPIGYIQYYNILDFSRDEELPPQLPHKAAALDFYIGEVDYLSRGYGSGVLKTICAEMIWQEFDACCVDPDIDNYIAIKGYQSAGFDIFHTTTKTIWMVKKKS